MTEDAGEFCGPDHRRGQQGDRQSSMEETRTTCWPPKKLRPPVPALLALQRTDPVYRATEQWFCSVEDFKAEAVRETVKNVKWISRPGAKSRIEPAWSPERCRLVHLPSAQLWGVPIPVFYCEECGEVRTLTMPASRLSPDLFRKEGSDAWYEYSRGQRDSAGKGTTCKYCGRAMNSPKRPTSWTSGLTPVSTPCRRY